MNFKVLLICLTVGVNGLIAQQNKDEVIKEVASVKIENDFLNRFFRNTSFQLYLTSDGNRIVANSDTKLYILDPSNGDVILEENVPNSANSVYNHRKFVILQDAGLILFANDPKARKENSLVAYDLQTGEKRWENENVLFEFSVVNVMFSAVAESKTPSNALDQDFSLLSKSKDMYASNHLMDEIIEYFPKIHSILVRSKDYVTLIDIETGETTWKFEQDMLVAKSKYYPSRNEIVLLNYDDAFFRMIPGTPGGKVLVLDASTGKEVHTMDYIGFYNGDHAYFKGDKLITGFLAIEIFDLDKGERIALSADKKGVEFIGDMKGRSEVPSHNIIGDEYAFTVTSIMGKEREVPMNSGHKSKLLKYEISTGELVLEKEINKQVKFIKQEGNYIICRDGKFNKSFLHGLNTETGDFEWKTEAIKGLKSFSERFTITSNQIVAGGKKELYFFDSKNGETVRIVDLKEMNIGNVERVESVLENILVIGKKGFAFIDKKGNKKGVDKPKKLDVPDKFSKPDIGIDALFPAEILRGYWNENYTYIFLEQKLSVYNNDSFGHVGSIHYSSGYSLDGGSTSGKNFPYNKMYLSNSGEYFLQLENNNMLTIYSID
ncbi:MAG: PQQ-binding-like beta-propeller repeat protein [Brumimicrobium sp.]